VSSRDRAAERLQAYHDGELPPRAMRRVAAALERSAESRAELDRLRAVGEWVREAEAARAPAAPDLWDAIALRLPALDAERAESAGVSAWWPAWAWRPLAAGAALAAVTAVVAIGLLREPEPLPDVVQWIDSEGVPVMVFDAPDDGTIIWVISPSEGDLSRSDGRAAV
jgi:anti-sigma-K factor RskA